MLHRLLCVSVLQNDQFMTHKHKYSQKMISLQWYEEL